MSTALSAAMPSPKPLFPPLTRDLAVTSLIAGIAADLTWEFWARVITPFLPGVGGPLEPAALVQSVFGLDSRFVAELIHLVVGFVFYPLGYLFVARPLAQAIVPSLPWWIVAAGFGVGLWIFALYVMAHLIAGLPAFLDSSPSPGPPSAATSSSASSSGRSSSGARRRPERRPKPLAQLDRHLPARSQNTTPAIPKAPAMATRSAVSRRPRVVIVGAGFGGLSAAKALGRAPVEVMVIDRHNYHLFQPLLYQVATAALSPADIAAPIRSVLRHHANTSVMLAKVTGADTVRQEVVLGARRVPFDFLVLATGARHAYFGHDGWELHAHGIKKIDDATFLRRKILLAFERAESESDPSERRRLLTFVVIGGGATGVEMAGAIAELARKALAVDFRTIDPRSARVTLIEAGPRLLPAFDELLSEKAKRSLEKLGVEVLVNAMVTGCDASAVSLGAARIETRTIVWGAGVRASAAGKWLGVETDRVGRVKVAPDLSVPGHSNVFVIGDTAHALDRKGQPLPGIAPAAKQQGAYVARAIVARLAGESPAPFHYRDFGSLATIGRRSAVVQLGRVHLSGYLAWWLWGLAHICFLIGFRNRLAVAMNWAWNYVSFQRGTRLITGSDPETDAAASSAAPAALLRESA